MTQFFGARWDAPRVDDATQVPTPVGELCLECGESIQEGDRGLITCLVSDEGAMMRPIHMECELRATMSHCARQCECFTTHPSARAEALATLRVFNEWRATRGLGPL